MDENELKKAINKLFNARIKDLVSEIPSGKDKLFSGNSDYWYLNACINQTSNFDAYCIGYLNAAKFLARIVIYSGRYVDTLVYPIIFLYRHYAELMLKNFIKRGVYITQKESDDSDKKLSNTHGLYELWNLLKPILDEIYADREDYKKNKGGIESYINQINQIDPNSQAFRYDVTAHGKKSLKNVKVINILAFCQNMEKLTDLFEYIDFDLDLIIEKLAV